MHPMHELSKNTRFLARKQKSTYTWKNTVSNNTCLAYVSSVASKAVLPCMLRVVVVERNCKVNYKISYTTNDLSLIQHSYFAHNQLQYNKKFN